MSADSFSENNYSFPSYTQSNVTPSETKVWHIQYWPKSIDDNAQLRHHGASIFYVTNLYE